MSSLPPPPPPPLSSIEAWRRFAGVSRTQERVSTQWNPIAQNWGDPALRVRLRLAAGIFPPQPDPQWGHPGGVAASSCCRGRKVILGPHPHQSLLFDFYVPSPFCASNSRLHSLYNRGVGGRCCPTTPRGDSVGICGGRTPFPVGKARVARVFIVTWQREGVCRAWALGAGVGKARGDWDAERLGEELRRGQ